MLQIHGGAVRCVSALTSNPSVGHQILATNRVFFYVLDRMRTADQLHSSKTGISLEG